jgi:hypothetical protein
MAYAFMTFTFSSLLVVAFRAHSGRIDHEAQDGPMGVSLLFSEPIPFVWWNIHVLVALPAVWMA